MVFLRGDFMLKLVNPDEPPQGEVLSYVKEFVLCRESINGDNLLEDYLVNSSYEEWISYTDSCTDLNNFTYFLVNENSNVVGMCRINLSKDGFCSADYNIRPSLRGNGYGRVLLYLILERCKSLDCNGVYIVTSSCNIPSCKVLEFFGASYEDDDDFRKYVLEFPKVLKR